MDDVIYIAPEDIEMLDPSEYVEEPSMLFNKLPEFVKPLVKDADLVFSKIEEILYTTPAVINMIKATFPKEILQVVLTGDQEKKIAKGALELMTKKDGLLMATLIDPKTKKIVESVSLKNVKEFPELNQAMTNFATQIQMAQIAEQIQSIQFAIEDVRKGQESDRLAIAYSCQQKLLQAMEIKDPELRSRILLQVVFDAEDSRNLLMLSQKSNINFIKEQPESDFLKFFKGEKTKKIELRIDEIREGLNAVNMVSLAEAMAYYKLGEHGAARKSLTYFAHFINEAYLSTPGLVDRLDLIDPSPINYWSKTIPRIERNINYLPIYSEFENKGELK